MKTAIENYTDLNIFILEGLVWVSYDQTKCSGTVRSVDYTTVPIPKYSKHVYFSEDYQDPEGSACYIEYVEDSRYKDIDNNVLWQTQEIGEYTYCVGDEGFVPNVDFRENKHKTYLNFKGFYDTRKTLFGEDD